MKRRCSNCGWEPDDPDTDRCEVCGEPIPPSPVGSDTSSDHLTEAGPRPPAAPSTPSPDVPNTVRNWAMAAHISAFAVLVVGIPVVGPLVVWLLKREEHPFVDEQGKEAVNFNLSMLLYGIVAGILVLVGIGLVLLPVVLVAWFVLTVIAAVKAANGEHHRYPVTIRFVR